MDHAPGPAPDGVPRLVGPAPARLARGRPGARRRRDRPRSAHARGRRPIRSRSARRRPPPSPRRSAWSTRTRRSSSSRSRRGSSRSGPSTSGSARPTAWCGPTSRARGHPAGRSSSTGWTARPRASWSSPRRPESKQYLQAQFSSGTAERRYVAIVEGVVTANEGTLRDVLVEERSLRVRPADPTRPPPKGRRARIAITRYRVIERRADVTRVALQLGTGRRHQIRVQLAKLGHPVVGDVPPRRAPGSAPPPVPSRHAARLPPSGHRGAGRVRQRASRRVRQPRAAGGSPAAASRPPPGPRCARRDPRGAPRAAASARPTDRRPGPPAAAGRRLADAAPAAPTPAGSDVHEAADGTCARDATAAPTAPERRPPRAGPPRGRSLEAERRSPASARPARTGRRDAIRAAASQAGTREPRPATAAAAPRPPVGRATTATALRRPTRRRRSRAGTPGRPPSRPGPGAMRGRHQRAGPVGVAARRRRRPTRPSGRPAAPTPALTRRAPPLPSLCEATAEPPP